MIMNPPKTERKRPVARRVVIRDTWSRIQPRVKHNEEKRRKKEKRMKKRIGSTQANVHSTLHPPLYPTLALASSPALPSPTIAVSTNTSEVHFQDTMMTKTHHCGGMLKSSLPINTRHCPTGDNSAGHRGCNTSGPNLPVHYPISPPSHSQWYHPNYGISTMD